MCLPGTVLLLYLAHHETILVGQRMLSMLILGVSAKADLPEVTRVRSWLHSYNGMTMLPRDALAESVRFESNLCAISGAVAYIAAAERWQNDGQALLQPFQTSITRCDSLADGEVAVSWRVEWEPPSLQWLLMLAALFRLKIERFDLDPCTISSFRWRALLHVVAHAVSRGTIRLPLSVVEGSATLTLDATKTQVISHKENIDLVSLADAGNLLNRRSAQDCAEFLDVCRRPENLDPDEWGAQVRSRVLASVPGAGVLDIEPGDPSEGLFALVGFALSIMAAASLTARAIWGEPSLVDF